MRCGEAIVIGLNKNEAAIISRTSLVKSLSWLYKIWLHSIELWKLG